MKKRKLRGYVLPTIYLLVLGVMAFGITLLSQNLLENQEMQDDNYNYSMSVFDEKEEETNNNTEEKKEEVVAVKPFTSDKVSVSKEYYNKDETAENQEKALIYYENTYMPNTGILYESDEKFDVVAIMDGTVKEIKTDEILGSVMTIEHSNKLTSIYYTLSDITVKKGDKVTIGQTIAKSGQSKLQTSKKETLLFETYLNGTLINPNNIFQKNINELS